MWVGSLKIPTRNVDETCGTFNQYPHYCLLKQKKFDKYSWTETYFSNTILCISRFYWIFHCSLSPQNTLNPEIISWICLNHEIRIWYSGKCITLEICMLSKGYFMPLHLDCPKVFNFLIRTWNLMLQFISDQWSFFFIARVFMMRK